MWKHFVHCSIKNSKVVICFILFDNVLMFRVYVLLIHFTEKTHSLELRFILYLP